MVLSFARLTYARFGGVSNAVRLNTLNPANFARFMATKPVDSLFSDLTKSAENQKVSNNNVAVAEESDAGSIQYVEPEKDEKLQKFLNPDPFLTVNALLTPLKRDIYNENVRLNGFFKNNATVTLKDGNSYTLNLSQKEVESLEPSIYLRSWRIKSSVKKTNIVLRALKDLPLKKAITQLHFMEKKVARDLVEMLERGLKDAEKMKYNVDDLYISESWVHTDGNWMKRVDCKGRGRAGVMTFKWVSVRFLLKTGQTNKRLAYLTKKRTENKDVRSFVSQGKIRGGAPGFYRW